MTAISPHLLSTLFLLGGVLCLGLGATWLVEGSSRMALRLGVTPMVVGLTVVGFGTSMPEFSVSLLAALRDSRGLSLGNAVGSNVMNLLLVMGLAAVIRPLKVQGSRKALRRDLCMGVLPAVVLLVMAWNGNLGRLAAAILVAIFVAFLWMNLKTAHETRGQQVAVRGTMPRNAVLAVVGIVLLVGGADMMVRGGVSLARAAGISEAVIGLTLVAFGTSLPELATSVAASFKGESEISVGNVLGSNVFNLGLIVGVAFLVRPGQVPTFVIRHDLLFLIGATMLVGLVILRDGAISRREGFAMLSVFAGYLVFMVLRGFG